MADTSSTNDRAIDEQHAPEHGATEDHGDRLYTPPVGEAQLTFRAVLTGCLLGGVVGAMNIYFGLRTGWSIGGSLIAAILGFSVWAGLGALGPFRKYTVGETNITQTAGSAAGSMASAAGLLSAIPALSLLGTDLSYLQLSLWAISVAYLGVFFAVPLRNQFVVVEKLRFPTGTATAETIVSMFAEGAQAIAQARALVIWGIAAGLFALVAYFFPVVGHPEPHWWILGPMAAWGFSLLISPLMFGAGILIGPRIGISLLLGAIVSWGFLGPYVVQQGWADGDAIMSYKTGPRGWILWPGVAIMVADAMMSLVLSWRSIVNTFRPPVRGSVAEAELEDRSQRIPNAWWLGGLACGSTATVTVAWFVFGIPWWMTLIAIAMSSLLAVIAVRATGETDINPIGGMGKVTQLAFGALAPGQMVPNLMGAAITGSGASQAGDMMQDLKAGRLLGSSPRKQIIAQCFGIAAGVLVVVPIFKLFQAAGERDENFAIGGTNVPAPAAQAWKAMAEVLTQGLDALPPHALWAVVAGAAFGVLVPLVRKLVPATKAFMPSGLAFGIAFIVPAYYAVAMFLGSMALVIWRKAAPKQAAIFWIAVASGLIAGEGLMGVITAALAVFGIGPEWMAELLGQSGGG